MQAAGQGAGGVIPLPVTGIGDRGRTDPGAVVEDQDAVACRQSAAVGALEGGRLIVGAAVPGHGTHLSAGVVADRDDARRSGGTGGVHRCGVGGTGNAEVAVAVHHPGGVTDALVIGERARVGEGPGAAAHAGGAQQGDRGAGGRVDPQLLTSHQGGTQATAQGQFGVIGEATIGHHPLVGADVVVNGGDRGCGGGRERVDRDAAELLRDAVGGDGAGQAQGAGGRRRREGVHDEAIGRTGQAAGRAVAGGGGVAGGAVTGAGRALPDPQHDPAGLQRWQTGGGEVEAAVVDSVRGQGGDPVHHLPADQRAAAGVGSHQQVSPLVGTAVDLHLELQHAGAGGLPAQGDRGDHADGGAAAAVDRQGTEHSLEPVPGLQAERSAGQSGGDHGVGGLHGEAERAVTGGIQRGAGQQRGMGVGLARPIDNGIGSGGGPLHCHGPPGPSRHRDRFGSARMPSCQLPPRAAAPTGCSEAWTTTPQRSASNCRQARPWSPAAVPHDHRQISCSGPAQRNGGRVCSQRRPSALRPRRISPAAPWPSRCRRRRCGACSSAASTGRACCVGAISNASTPGSRPSSRIGRPSTAASATSTSAAPSRRMGR